MAQMITLYSAQPQVIADNIRQGNTHYAKLDSIREKYGEEVAPVFTQAYNWFVRQAEQIVPRPPEAESAIWVYHDLHLLEQHSGYEIMILDIPLTEVIFFSMSDWNKVLNQRFLALSDQEYTCFTKKLEKQGIIYEGDLFRKPFYPQLKQEVIKSWQNLFRFHQPILTALTQGSSLPIKDIQAAIWKISAYSVKNYS